MTVERLMKREVTRLGWQADRLIDDLLDGKRILVRKADTEDEVEWLNELVWLVRTYGTAQLLFITRNKQKAGWVERASPTLLLGYLPERAAIEANNDVIAAEVASWLPVCRQALSLSSARQALVP